jgi:hypothetical protein
VTAIDDGIASSLFGLRKHGSIAALLGANPSISRKQ